MKYWLALLLCLSGYLAIGQDYISVAGKVVDSLDAKPLPYVNISVKHKALGAVSNEAGEFVFNIPKSAQKDTLVFTFIGYSPKELVVAAISNPGLLTIALTPKESYLQTITVTSQRVTAEGIIKAAIKNIPANYPNQPHVLKGFFRDWKTIDFREGTQDNGVLIEAAVNVVNFGYAKKGKKNPDKVYIKEIRRSELPEKPGWYYHNSLQELLHRNYVKNNNTKDFSDSSPVFSFPNKFKYTFAETSNDNQYFVVEASEGNSELIYTIYINAADYAIARIDLKNKKEFNRGEMRIKAIDNTQRFRKFKDKWYLSYSRRNWQLEFINAKVSPGNRTENYNQEFLVNDIQNTDLNKTEDLGYPANGKKPLEFQVKDYNEAFWKSYNILKDNPLNPAIQTFFEKKKSLTEQYKNAGKLIANPATDRSLPEQWSPDNRWLFSKADTLQGSLNQFRSCYNVHFYDLAVKIDPTEKRITGTSTIYFITEELTDKIQIDLNPALAIENIEWSGQTLPFTREYNAVFIQFPKVLPVGGKHNIKIKYSGHPLEPDFRIPNYGAFVWSQDSEENAWLQSICQGSGANGWWPNKDHISDKPDSVLLTVTLPASLVNIANGQLIRKNVSANTATYQWKVNYPMLNYNLAVNAGNYVHWQEPYAGNANFTLNFYALKPDETKAKAAFKIVAPMLHQYEKFFGPYPFPKDEFKIIQTPYPMEHQGCVAVGPDFKEELILHETAHEWWGNSVSCTDLADIWLHEAFATYAVYMFLEANRSKAEAAAYLDYLSENIKGEFPLVGTYGVNHIHYDITDAYSKGALLLHTVRNLIHDDAVWFGILKGLQTDFKYKSITTSQLIAYINQEAKQDFSYLFAQYLYHPEEPILELRLTELNSQLKVAYRWQNTRPDFKMPVPVTITPDQFKLIYPTTTWQEIELNGLGSETFKIGVNKLIKVAKVKVK